MDERFQKRRGPITLLCENRRLRWMVAVSLTIIILVIAIVVLRSEFRDLQTRVSKVSPGMTREEVEVLFGPPALFLRDRQPGLGGTLVWVDQLWQADVVLDRDGKVVRTGCTRSYSALNRIIGRAPSLSL
jgi:hypothetical protein